MIIFGIPVTLSRRKKLYKGSISERISGIFDFDIDYTGKTILDVGCSIGMIAYEISKSRPKSIHGIDSYRPAVNTARSIFMGVDTESEFHAVDLANDRALHRVLKPRYDIVLYLAVWQHLRRSEGRQKAAEITRELAGRCEEYLLARTPLKEEKEFNAILEAMEFSVVGHSSVISLTSGPPRPTDPKTRVTLFRAPTRPKEYLQTNGNLVIPSLKRHCDLSSNFHGGL